MTRRALAVAAALLVAGCDGDDEEPRGEGARAGGEARVETVAGGLEAPWEIAFLPDGRALITERPGRVRLLERDGGLRPDPVAEVEVAAVGEAGLLGLAVDPEFEDNGFVYLYRTVEDGNEIARYRLDGGRLEEDDVVVDGIEAATIHDGGRIHFGPDERLYISSGDAAQDSLAQDPGSLNGKFLRMELEALRGAGGRPEVFSLGHRNPQGFDWRPGNRTLVASEHGAAGNDEVNAMRQGANYGWPEVEGEDHGEFEAPATVYEEAIAPSGATFVSRPGSAWSGDFLMAALVGEQIRRLRVDARGQVTRDEALLEGDFGRLRTVVEGPDGALYALTSNRDGRGSPREGDDRVLRIVPPAD
jgi:glucose/arabinose dehydrogenase